MKFIKNNLANLFTLGNLFSGSVGVVHLLFDDYKTTAICLVISLVLDFFDGFVARAMKSNSDLGVQLDSLADMVTFGFLPGVVMYKALEPFSTQFLGIDVPFEIKYLGFFVTLFSCLRLAIFNIDTDQRYYFKGLNTPTNTIFLFGLFYCYQESRSFAFLMENELALLIITFLFSWLLVSSVKMIANKFKSMKLQDNYPKIILVVGAILLVIIFGFEGIPMFVIYYIIVSLLFQKTLKN